MVSRWRGSNQYYRFDWTNNKKMWWGEQTNHIVWWSQKVVISQRTWNEFSEVRGQKSKKNVAPPKHRSTSNTMIKYQFPRLPASLAHKSKFQQPKTNNQPSLTKITKCASTLPIRPIHHELSPFWFTTVACIRLTTAKPSAMFTVWLQFKFWFLQLCIVHHGRCCSLFYACIGIILSQNHRRIDIIINSNLWN